MKGEWIYCKEVVLHLKKNGFSVAVQGCGTILSLIIRFWVLYTGVKVMFTSFRLQILLLILIKF